MTPTPSRQTLGKANAVGIPLARGRIAGLDGLRTVAVLVVFAGHYLAAAFPNRHWLEFVFPGMLGVTLFFVISGFLISSILFDEFRASSTIALSHFYIRRLLRLTPALWVYVTITLIAYLLYDGRVNYWDFVAAFTYTSNYYMIATSSVQYYMPVWSLAIEEHFYLILPLTMLLAVRRSVRVFMIVVVCGVVAEFVWRRMVADSVNMDWQYIYWRTDTRLDSLLFGVLLTCLLALPHARRVSGIVSHWPGLVGGIGLMAVSVLYRDEAFRMSARYTLQGLGLMLLVGYVILSHEWIATNARAVLETRPVIYISKISYSLYLWHLTILKFAEHVFGTFGVIGVALCAAASLTMASLSYKFVEIPFFSLRRKFGSHIEMPHKLKPKELVQRAASI